MTFDPFNPPQSGLHYAFLQSKMFWEAMSVEQLKIAIKGHEERGNIHIVRELQKVLNKKEKKHGKHND